MKVIGIIGSRRRDTPEDSLVVEKKFLKVYDKGDTIVSGGCPRGADRFAENIAQAYRVPIMIIYADWNNLGKGAGFIRNTEIAKKADVLIACVSKDRTGGTEDTIKKFSKPELVVFC